MIQSKVLSAFVVLALIGLVTPALADNNGNGYGSGNENGNGNGQGNGSGNGNGNGGGHNKPKPKVVGTFEDVTSVSIGTIGVAVEVRTGSSDKVAVTVSGTEDAVEGAKMRVVKGQLRVDVTDLAGIGGANDGCCGGGNAINIHVNGNASAVFNGLDSENFAPKEKKRRPFTKVEVVLPKGTPVEIVAKFGSVKVEGTEAFLSLTLFTVGKTVVGKVDDLAIKVIGQSDIDVAEVAGRVLSVWTKGMLELTVKAGDIEQLQADTVGTAEIEFHGTVQDVMVGTYGAASIEIGRLTGQVLKPELDYTVVTVLDQE